MDLFFQKSGLLGGLLLVYSMKTAVIGARGFIGRHFYAYYAHDKSPFLATHHTPFAEMECLTLASPFSFPFSLEGHTHVLIAAGFSHVGQCEREKDYSYQCNVEAPLCIAKEGLKKGVTPIFFSTDYVFDGTKAPYSLEDPLSPLNEYGRQKAELERRALALCQGNCLIIRLSKVYGDMHETPWIQELFEKLQRGEEVKVAHDQVFAPIHIQDVVDGVSALQAKGQVGIYQFAGPQPLSRYELAKLVAQKIGAKETLLKQISIEELADGIKRPKNTTLLSKMGKRKVEEAIAL